MARHDYAATNWWNAPKDPEVDIDSPHHILFSHVRQLEEDQLDIHLQNCLNARLYANRELMTFEWDGVNEVSNRPLNANLENVVQSVIDTVRSIIGKNNPKATIVSRGADFDIYLKARQLDRFLWSTFVSQETYKHGEEAFDDCAVYGTGVVKIDVDGDEVFTERVHPDEIIVDQRECMSTREPRTLYQRKLISRAALVEMFGRKKEIAGKIETAQTKNFQYTSYQTPGEDQVVVIEAWRLPVGKKPGRHIICIENCVLLDEKYTRKRFPFVFIRWANAPSGFYGRSLTEGLIGYQVRLNELNADIRVGQNTMCVPRIMVDQGTAFVKTQLDSKIGKVLTYRGTKPEAVTWNAFNPEIYNERDRTRDSAFRFARVSELSSQAKLPTQARLDSSAALREFNAIEQDGFSPVAKNYERFYMEIAKHYLELYADLFRNKEVNKSQTFRSRYLVQQIDWADVDMDEDKYVLEISASSILNMTPAARSDKLNEWISAGLITPDEYKAMSGHPDLEKKADLMAANADFCELQIDRMLQGQEQYPDPISNLQANLRLTMDTYLHLSALEAPENILQLFRDYIENTKQLLAPPPAPMAPPMDPMMAAQDPMAAGAPPADPMAAGMPPMGGSATPINTMTGSPAPGVSDAAAQAFLGLQ